MEWIIFNSMSEGLFFNPGVTNSNLDHLAHPGGVNDYYFDWALKKVDFEKRLTKGHLNINGRSRLNQTKHCGFISGVARTWFYWKIKVSDFSKSANFDAKYYRSLCANKYF